MKKLLLRYAASLFLVLFLQNCKNDDPSPSQGITGTWLLKSLTGNVTFGAKSFDINDPNSPLDSEHPNEIVFNAGGTGETGGEPFTYEVSGNTLTMTSSGIELKYKIGVAADELTLTLENEGAKNLIEIYNALLSPSEQISKYSETVVYTSLKKELATNGTPECLLTNYEYQLVLANGTKTESSVRYVYNAERKMIENTRQSGSEKNTLSFEEIKENRGSKTLPYLIRKWNHELDAKYYSDKNGRIDRIEFFDDVYQERVNSTRTFTYNNEGNAIKTKEVFFDGTSSVYDYEFTNGNMTKYYYQNFRSDGTATGPRVLSSENTFSSAERKNTLVSIANTGKPNKNYITETKTYDSAGKVTSTSKYTFKADGKGNPTEEKYEYSDGRIGTYKNTFDCSK